MLPAAYSSRHVCCTAVLHLAAKLLSSTLLLLTCLQTDFCLTLEGGCSAIIALLVEPMLLS
jgi:hypothetical protein